MASHCLTVLVVLAIVNTSLQNANNNEIQDESLLAEAAAAIMKEQNVENIGSVLNSFIQSGGAKQLGDVLQNVATSENAGRLLDGLSGLVGSMGGSKDDGDDNSPNLLQGLGTIMGALQGEGGKNNKAGALLQGLGSLVGGQGGQGGIDPAMIGTFLNMFANSQNTQNPQRKGKGKKLDKQRKNNEEPSFDVGDMMALAGNFLSKGQAGNNFMQFLPMVLQTIGSFAGPDAEKRAEGHSDHAWSMPPLMEKFHIIFDNFIHSDMGKLVLNVLGAEKTFKVFTDENGRFSYSKFGEMMENHSFRRHWIRMITDRIVDFLKYMSEPDVQKNYIDGAQYFANSFLKSQGFPKAALFDPAKPVETLTAFVNHAAKKYFEVRVKSKEYVKPAVEYAQELLRMAIANKGGDSRVLSNTLADTINLEIIEPLARVNRAYRYATTVPKCGRYVLCLVNEENQNELESLPALKKLLYKGSSIVASWFLSDSMETPFWILYKDIVEGANCKTFYSESCNGFHQEEIKVTTEYVHNEL